MATGAGLRSGAKAPESPPDPNAGVPVLDSTTPGTDGDRRGVDASQSAAVGSCLLTEHFTHRHRRIPRQPDQRPSAQRGTRGRVLRPVRCLPRQSEVPMATPAPVVPDTISLPTVRASRWPSDEIDAWLERSEAVLAGRALPSVRAPLRERLVRRRLETLLAGPDFAWYLNRPRPDRPPRREAREEYVEAVPVAVVPAPMREAAGATLRTLCLTEPVADKQWRRHGPGQERPRDRHTGPWRGGRTSRPSWIPSRRCARTTGGGGTTTSCGADALSSPATKRGVSLSSRTIRAGSGTRRKRPARSEDGAGR